MLLDFRNVAGKDVANTVAADVKSPIARVTVEPADSLGAPASRVRIALSQPVAHHVRSERNTVVIDFDKPSAKAVPYVLPPATRTAKTEAAPDAMLALQEKPASDPIAALGLETGVGGPSASGPTSNPAPVAATQASAAAAVRSAAQPQTPGAADRPPNTGSRGRQFTGHPISLDFQGADLRAVLRTFAEISGLNIVIDPAVQGTVDVALRDVPWDQALDIILRANKLGYSVDGTIVRIAPNTVLKAEEEERKALLDSQNDASQLRDAAAAAELCERRGSRTLLKTATFSRSAVRRNVDPRTNTLIVRDVPSQFPEITDAHRRLDRAQPQVEIEARIVQTNKTYARALGVQWGFGGRVDPALGNTTNLAFPNNGSLTGRTGVTQGPTTGSTTSQPTAVNLGVTGAPSAVGLALGSVNGAFNLDVALSALESSGNGRLLSTPRVTTQNNVAAEMTQGVQIPIQTVSNNTVTVSFKDAALTLKVTPQITVGEHGHHADFGRERHAGLQPAGEQHPADQHPARQHPGARQRRPDDGHRRHLRQQLDALERQDAGARQRAAAQVAVQARSRRRVEHRAADFHHPAHHQELTAEDDMRNATRLIGLAALVAATRFVRRRRAAGQRAGVPGRSTSCRASAAGRSRNRSATR